MMKNGWLLMNPAKQINNERTVVASRPLGDRLFEVKYVATGDRPPTALGQELAYQEET